MAKRKKAPALPSKMEFIGARMATFLHGVAQDPSVPVDLRETAKKLQLRWDGVSNLSFQINNPIVIAELEAKLFPKKKEHAA